MSTAQNSQSVSTVLCCSRIYWRTCSTSTLPSKRHSPEPRNARLRNFDPCRAAALPGAWAEWLCTSLIIKPLEEDSTPGTVNLFQSHWSNQWLTQFSYLAEKVSVPF